MGMAADPGPKPPGSELPLTAPARAREHPAWLRAIYAAVFLYLFLCAMNVMGGGLQLFGDHSDRLQDLLASDNPVIALLGGVIATAIVQSSSFTTAIIVGLVGAGQMTLETAVFAVMGANVGTSITNNIVAMTTMRIRRQFRRAYTAAMTHGFINLLTVSLLFPLEWISQSWFSNGQGLLTNFSMWFAGLLGLGPREKWVNPVTVMTRPVVDLCNLFGDVFTTTEKAQGVVVALLGLMLLFISLVFMVTNLKGAFLRRIEGLFSSIFFRNDLLSGTSGVVSTIIVQSSSVTTSLMVPLVGAGAIGLRRALPFMLGCNLGTTMTAVIAASTNPVATAVGVAICHVSFNVIAVCIWYPLRFVPMGLATWYGRLAARSRQYYFWFLGIVYFVIPVIGYLVSRIMLS